MKTHVFIVNDGTFPSHLKYLFAGTGAQDKDENISLLADIKRVRPGDFVLFYIEATTRVKGGFYGIFKIADQSPLVFHTPGQNGFLPNLGKKLIYRTLIEPYEVYSDGVPEWEALDKLPLYATEIQWSLIYRKLKGKRGCTPLLPWEAQRLMDMIRNKNAGKPIANAQFTGGFDWDKTNRKIITTQNPQNYPGPRTFNYNVLAKICELQQQRKAYEVYLQLYFTENIGIDPNLNPIVGNNLIWFGNEIACGVGMQKIDILTICQNSERKEYRLIELKDEPVGPEVVDQIEYYVNWASQSSGRHLDGAFNWNIQPIIVAPPHKPRNWQSVLNAFRNYNQKQISLPILYFEFVIDCGRSIKFEKICY
ncbi:hypothetical protein JGI3_01547 [Candidatus Kryptobacter tengchongensis]|nr:hypothetical protein JGI3_01547 [Candidatus Kryptobacter tengchongensis]